MGKRKKPKGTETDMAFLFSEFFKVFDESVEEPPSITMDVGDAPVANFEEYLKKGERLFSLAREKFSREFSKIELSEADEKIFSVFPLETDTMYDIVCRISRTFVRPLLKSMEASSDEYANKLLDAVELPYLKVTLQFSNDIYAKSVLNSHRKKIGDAVEPCLRIEILEEGFPPLVVYGLKNVAHEPRSRDGIFRTDDNYAIADMGDLFSYLVLHKYISQALISMRTGDGAVSGNVSRMLRERVQAYEKEFVLNNVRLFPEECNSLLETYTIEDVFNCPIYMFGFKRGRYDEFFEKYVAHNGVEVVDFANYKLVNDALARYSDKNKPVAYFLGGTSQLFYCFYKNQYIPYHALLTEGKHGDVPFWYPLPSSSKSKKKYYHESSGKRMLADLFRVIATEKCTQKQMVSYYQELERSYAKSYMLKKEITKKCRKAMRTSLFNKYFGFVEFDTETDLKKIEEIAREFRAVKETYLSCVDSSQNAIRFRKLGQHKASGLYYPAIACLCVDIRHPSSLIHEYGHLIDYTYGSLSKEYAFSEIRTSYAERLEGYLKDNEAAKKRLNSSSKYNKAYYLLPTEIFARCFELYVSKCLGVQNSIVPDEFDRMVYPTDSEFMELVKYYFDSLNLGGDFKVLEIEMRMEKTVPAQPLLN